MLFLVGDLHLTLFNQQLIVVYSKFLDKIRHLLLLTTVQTTFCTSLATIINFLVLLRCFSTDYLQALVCIRVIFLNSLVICLEFSLLEVLLSSSFIITVITTSLRE